ncbi:MAG: glycosyltransferase, partial [Actinobacteria bacterium]|nr:glycosyltransferase [Actinomycetota bacterium]
QSSDGTGELARALARTSPDARLGLTVLKGRPRPRGWAGKPWAMAQGVERALAAPVAPEWVLFSDADIAHPPGSLRRLVASAVAGDKPAVSVMARLATQSRWERLTMPLFVYFFAQIYPFRWVNDPERATAAAAGGCFLVNAEALEEVGGVAAFADATIDDVALAKALSAAGFDLWLTLAGGSGGSGPGQAPCIKSLRHYPRLADIWAMVARSAYTQLGCKPAALAGAMAALSFVYLSPPLLCAIGLVAAKPLTTLAGLAAWTAMAASYLPLARYYKVSPASALALPFTCSLYMAMTLDSARRHRLGTTGWKGRPTALA